MVAMAYMACVPPNAVSIELFSGGCEMITIKVTCDNCGAELGVNSDVTWRVAYWATVKSRLNTIDTCELYCVACIKAVASAKERALALRGEHD